MPFSSALFFAPYLMAFSAAFLSVVSALPGFVPGITLRSWYRSVVRPFAWVLMAGAVLLVVVFSSPWLILGAILIGLIALQMFALNRQQVGKMDEEALGFLQMLTGLMAAGQTVEQALRAAVQSNEFTHAFPRMTDQAREIVSLMDAHTPMSKAVETVGDAAAAPSRMVWSKIAAVARMIENEVGGIPAEAQRDTLQSVWQVLFEFHTIQQDLKREMTSVEMAKWVFVVIMPGMNIYQAMTVRGYLQNFLLSPIGQATLALEAAAIVSIFVIFSQLQKLPEVKL